MKSKWHLSLNPIHHSRMKHIQIDLHFVRDLVQKDTLHVKHVHTQDQLADLLTKLLSQQRTTFLISKISLIDGSPILRGRIKEICINSAKIKQHIPTKVYHSNYYKSFHLPHKIFCQNYSKCPYVSITKNILFSCIYFTQHYNENCVVFSVNYVSSYLII